MDKTRFLAESRRVLKPGGVSLFSDITAMTRDPILSWQPALQLHLITPAKWYRLIEAAGFSIEEKKLIGNCVYPGFRRRLKLTAPERRQRNFNTLCKKGTIAPVRWARFVQASALEWALCRSVLPIFSMLRLREYVLILARRA